MLILIIIIIIIIISIDHADQCSIANKVWKKEKLKDFEHNIKLITLVFNAKKIIVHYNCVYCKNHPTLHLCLMLIKINGTLYLCLMLIKNRGTLHFNSIYAL